FVSAEKDRAVMDRVAVPPMRKRPMRMKCWLWGIVAFLPSGCGIFEYSAINTVVATARQVDEWKTRAHYRCLADKAWTDARRACPGEKFSKDYAKGFKRGYVETIDRNGTPLPPSMPPYCYRAWHYQSPAGHEAIDEWFSGYRHGAAVAVASGYRDWVIL